MAASCTTTGKKRLGESIRNVPAKFEWKRSYK
jgi:hypothetical protein